MKTPCLPFVVAALLACSPLGTMAQTGAANAASTASTASTATKTSKTTKTTEAPLALPTRVTKPAPQLLTPAEKRETATAAGELRPVGPPTTQLSIPLGKGADKPTSPSADRGKSARTGGSIDDSVARCNAEVDANERAKCRDRLAHQAPSR